jgi:drug/metabolite transporter (DMT)-like permease
MKQLTNSQSWLAPMLYMSLAMAMWAIIDHIPGFFTQRYTTFEIVWLRYSVHLVFMLVVFGPRVKMRLVRTRRLGLQVVRGLLMMGMHLSFIFAIKYISFKETMAGFWVAPLLLLGLSAWWGEKSDEVQWAITLVSFCCILMILRPLNGLLHPATLLSIGMALCFAIYMQMTRSMSGEDILASLFYTALTVWVILSVLMPFYWVTPNGWDMLLFVAVGLLGFVCLYGFDKAAEVAPTWKSAPFAMIQPIYLIGIDFGLRGFNPGRLSLAAAGLVIACFGLLTWRNKNLRTITEVPHV